MCFSAAFLLHFKLHDLFIFFSRLTLTIRSHKRESKQGVCVILLSPISKWPPKAQKCEYLTFPSGLRTGGTHGFLFRTTAFCAFTPPTPSKAPHLFLFRLHCTLYAIIASTNATSYRCITNVWERSRLIAGSQEQHPFSVKNPPQAPHAKVKIEFQGGHWLDRKVLAFRRRR
jgi:hypothetical protein